KGFVLSPFQVQAVEAIRSGANVLVSAPTGAGKTLVAEYAIEEAVARGRRCIYTAPIKALSNQKYRDFREAGLDVGLLTGDVTINQEAAILIMTTEILRNAIFENPALLADVEFAVFDEVHYMDDRERGTVWEEALIFAPPSVRLVCLSATIDNLEELGGWLDDIREQPLEVIRSTLRPVPLSHRMYASGLGLFPVTSLEKARRAVGPAPQRGRGRRGNGRGQRGGRGRSPVAEGPPDPVPLLSHLEDDSLLPALVFSFSRKDCERLARAARGRQLLNKEEKARMEALQRELLVKFQADEREMDGELLTLARAGISYHHAGLLPIHKELVERLFTSGLLKLLFTTETFALGINMPARTAVFASLRKFDGVDFDWLRTRDYLQMAGRAGRQGIDKEGLVVSLLGARDVREAPLRRLIEGQPERVESRFRLSYSTILHLVDVLGRERIGEAWEKSFNRYQHSGRQRKKRERNERREQGLIDAHLAFLEELRYLEGDELLPRGRIARSINGFELQVTELLMGGTLENLPPRALAMIFAALVHESRPTAPTVRLGRDTYRGVRAEVDAIIRHLSGREAHHAIPRAVKPADWGLSTAVLAWHDGAPFEELEELSPIPPGDLCRSLRMALQLMRQVRRAIDPSWDLFDRLGEARSALNRDVVDARRQLELG
ncbi:MAG: DEAD/DEAH box helicase, partial [Planctomycetota bacterium]|nr:DEAD/DEAH box helicase [Planctomycetota bacterium]